MQSPICGIRSNQHLDKPNFQQHNILAFISQLITSNFSLFPYNYQANPTSKSKFIISWVGPLYKALTQLNKVHEGT